MKVLRSIVLIGAVLLLAAPTFAQSMAKKFKTVKTTITIDAPAQKVWEALAVDYGHIGNFSPYIYSSNYLNGSLKGEVGAQRQCNFDAQGKRWVREEIQSIDHRKMVLRNAVKEGQKLPLDTDNSQAFYRVKDNGDGTSTASYEFQFRTKPAFMGGLAKGGFKKQLAGTLIGLKHYVETGEKVTPTNKRYEEIKERYEDGVVTL